MDFFFAHSNLDILFKGALNNKIHKKFDHLFDFALEGLEEFNYRRQCLREQTDSKKSRPDVGRTSSFPLTRRPARSPCHPSQGTPGARVSKVMVSPHANEPPLCTTSKTEEAEVMVQGNDHHQQSPSYRACPVPMIGEDDVDFSRISTQGAQEKVHYSYTTSVGGMLRGGTESGHARFGESRFGRGGTHSRHTPPANMTCSDAAFKTFPDEKQRGGGTIFVLDSSGSQDSKYKIFKSPFPHPQAELKRGERTDYLEGFQRPQGRDVRLDRRLHTTEAQAFAGTRALRTKSCVALLDTSSPASFIREKIWNDMLGSGAASSDEEMPTQSRRWGGFHGKPLTTSSSVRLNVLLGRKGTISCESSEDTPVRTVVWAHIVPDRVMSYDLLLGRESWDHFPVKKYRDTNEDETVVTFTA